VVSQGHETPALVHLPGDDAEAARIEGELEDQEIIDAGEGSRVRGAHTSAEASRWVAFNHEAVPEIEFASSEIEIGLVSFTDRWAWNAL